MPNRGKTAANQRGSEIGSGKKRFVLKALLRYIHSRGKKVNTTVHQRRHHCHLTSTKQQHSRLEVRGASRSQNKCMNIISDTSLKTHYIHGRHSAFEDTFEDTVDPFRCIIRTHHEGHQEIIHRHV